MQNNYLLSALYLSLSNNLINAESLSLFKSFASIWDDAQWAIQDPTKSEADTWYAWHTITPEI